MAASSNPDSTVFLGPFWGSKSIYRIRGCLIADLTLLGGVWVGAEGFATQNTQTAMAAKIKTVWLVRGLQPHVLGVCIGWRASQTVQEHLPQL